MITLFYSKYFQTIMNKVPIRIRLLSHTRTICPGFWTNTKVIYAVIATEGISVREIVLPELVENGRLG
jgi:hypothetical protein